MITHASINQPNMNLKILTCFAPLQEKWRAKPPRTQRIFSNKLKPTEYQYNNNRTQVNRWI
jgi:hypothetical protein